MASAGTAYVDVEAKLDDFASQIESALAGIEGQVSVEADVSSAEAAIASVEADQLELFVEADVTQAQAEVDAVDGGETAVDVGAETSEAESEIAAVDGGETEIKVKADTAEAKASIDDLGGSVEGLVSDLAPGGGALSNFAASVAEVGGVSKGTAGGLAALAAGAAVSVSALMEIEVVGAKLNTVLETTGAGAYITAGEIDALADSMEKQTGQSAESITTSATLLATFSGLSNEAAITSGVFERSIEATADIAALMGGSAADAALRLGRALDNPVSGMTALQRSGVSFTQSQKDTITALAESGDMLGAQGELLSVVESQVGGVAEAYGSTLAGSLDKAKHSMGEFGESIVSPTIPVLEQLADAVGRAAGTFNDFFGGAKDDAWSDWWRDATGQGADYAKAYGAAVGGAKSETDGFAAAADDAADALGRVNERLQAYLDGQFDVPVAERALRASFESLTASLDAPVRSADDVSASLQGIVERTVDLGVASGNMPSAVSGALYGLAALQSQGKLSAEDVALVTSQLLGIPGSTEAEVSTPGAVEAKNQADAVGDAVRGVPPNKETTITAVVGKALIDLSEYKRMLDTIPKNITTYANVVTSGSAKTSAVGGPLGRGELSLVGEEGPEFFVPNTGGNILPAENTARLMLDAQKGGGFSPTVNVYAPTGNGPELARIISDELRKLERAGR